MTPMTIRRVRWSVPLVVAATILGGVKLSAASSATSPSSPALPPRTAEQLISDVAGSSVSGMSGTVEEHASLGLPALPGSSTGGAGVSLQSLVTGSHTLRIWAEGPSRQRVALLGQLAENDVVRNGADVWTYDSQSQAVTHARLPVHTDPSGASGIAVASATPETPATATAKVLALIDPTTSVAVNGTTTVAGRSAYRLVVAPRDARSLIGRVEIAIDGRTSVPLAVEVFARHESKPAIDVHFVTVSFATPNASVFSFTAPPGSPVKEVSSLATGDASNRPPAARTAAGPTTLGSGWTTVVVLPAGNGSLTSANALLGRLATAVPGGRLVTSSLLNALITPDGRMFVGAVSAADLQHVVASGRGL